MGKATHMGSWWSMMPYGSEALSREAKLSPTEVMALDCKHGHGAQVWLQA